MKLTIKGKEITGTPTEIVNWVESNLSSKEQRDFINGLTNHQKDINTKEAQELIEHFSKNKDMVKAMISSFGEKRPDDNFKEIEDGKVEIPITLKKSSERKIEIIKKKENKSTDEVINEVLTKQTDKYKDLDYSEIESFYQLFNISENDRLKNFQVVKKFLSNGFNTCEGDIETGNEKQKEFAKREFATYKFYITPVMENVKLFELDDEVVPMLTLQDFDEQKSTFPSIGIDCNVWLEHKGVKNFYFGFLIGSYYTEDNIHYRGVTMIYASKNADGEYRLNKELFILEKEYCKELTGHTGEKEYGKIRRFIYAFLNFINSPEIVIKDTPHNPKNDERRKKKGKITLPPSSRIQIHGTVLRKYVNDVNEGIRTFGYSHRFWVRGHYEHFWNRKKYNQIYKLDKGTLRQMGYDIKDGTVRKWKKAFIKGQGLMLEKEYKVSK